MGSAAVEGRRARGCRVRTEIPRVYQNHKARIVEHSGRLPFLSMAGTVRPDVPMPTLPRSVGLLVQLGKAPSQTATARQCSTRRPGLRPGITSHIDSRVRQEPAQLLVLLQHQRVETAPGVRSAGGEVLHGLFRHCLGCGSAPLIGGTRPSGVRERDGRSGGMLRYSVSRFYRNALRGCGTYRTHVRNMQRAPRSSPEFP